MLQKIIKVGNSAAITIPKEYLESIGAKVGSRVTISLDSSMRQLTVDLPEKKNVSTKNAKLSHEFQGWLNTFLKEDKGLLDELAGR